MKRFDYYKYQENENVEHLRKLSSIQTLECGFDLIESGIDFLKHSILSEKPKLSWPGLKREIRKILWKSKK